MINSPVPLGRGLRVPLPFIGSTRALALLISMCRDILPSNHYIGNIRAKALIIFIGDLSCPRPKGTGLLTQNISPKKTGCLNAENRMYIILIINNKKVVT
jgi:hypothetical protein